ncbi:MAG: TRAP transporter substrate-binding protein DctP [Spirochaetales bacterium]|nr:TRAP transporter substrate-binding protein DctP [Spirochaetales bacterium]
MKRHILFLMILFFLITGEVFGLTIKIGSLAPSGSPWDKCLKRLAAEWKSISGGKVQVKIYPGGIVGDETVMLRKIRLRQLHAAAITSVGLNTIAKGVLALSVPMLIRNDAELEYVLERMIPHFEEELTKKQFIPIIWTFAGWGHFFSKKPVVRPSDLKEQKMWVWEDNTNEIQIWKEAGFKPVPLPMPDVMTSLQSGMIETVMATPLSAAAYQWFGIANHMCGMNWAPMIAGIVIAKSTWDKIPETLRPRLLDAAREAGKTLNEETRRTDEEVMEIMKANGLVVNPVPEQAVREWKAVVDANFQRLIDEEFGAEAYEMIKVLLDEYRKQR